VRILAIYRHYWPDTTPYARLLKEILETLAAEGHSVTVFTAQPSYNDTRQAFQPRRQTVNGVEVLRMPLLPERKWIRPLWVLNLLIFLGTSILHLIFRRRYELVIANTHPPLLMGCTLRIAHALTRVPFIYHCQDLHPETMALSGTIKQGWIYRFLQSMDKKTCETAAATIVLSRDMLATFEARGQDCQNVEVINNFPLGLYSEPAELPEDLKHPGGGVFRVVFTGNIGNFQALDQIIEAARLLRDHTQTQFVFVGGGAAKEKLIRQAGDLVGRTVRFVPYQPVETAFAFLQQADLGIVSLRPEMYRLAFPSKCMMYLAAGCPLLAVIEPASELSELIETQKLGYVSASHEARDIADAVLSASRKAADWNSGRRALLTAKGEALFGQVPILDRWRELFSRRFPDKNVAAQADTRQFSTQQEAA
jgi:glycosyltransferase involved in cell wall biosynthesis